MEKPGIYINKNLLCTLILLCIFAVCYGETYDYSRRDYSKIPAAPTAQQFFDFKEYSVDYFHGIPSISLPIYTLRCGAIEVPVSLCYRGGGIRSQQAAGNAGMGWSIMCGAEIMHNVVGAPDEENHIIHGLSHLNKKERSFRSKLMDKLADYDPTDGAHYEAKLSWQATEGERYYLGLSDVANDTYSLYGLGLSADFVFSDSTQTVASSENALDIKKSDRIPVITDGGSDAYGYVVTTDAGLQYYFTSQDRACHSYKYGSMDLERMETEVYYASTWHLDEIIDLNGNKVRYFYHKLPNYYGQGSCYKENQYISLNEVQQIERNNIISGSSTKNYPLVLDSISAPGISVKFEYIHENFSNLSVPLISKIAITDETGSTRKISLSYEMHERPFLSKVIDGDEEAYTFEYYDTGDNYSYYPDSQDFGGYNNDIDNGRDLIPPVANYGGEADRSVQSGAAQKGILTKITYPTGGYTKFAWESNVMSHYADSPYNKNLNPTKSVKQTETDTIQMCMDDNYKKLKLRNWSFSGRQDVSLDLSRYFLMNPANLMTTDYENSHESLKDPYSTVNPPNYPHIRFVRKSDGKVVFVCFLDKETIELGHNPLYITGNLQSRVNYDVELVNPLSVDNAYDFLEANMRYHDSPAGRIYLTKTTYDGASLTSGQNLWPGLRIKTIISHTGDDNDEPLRKTFTYNLAKDPNFSIGTVQHIPDYEYMHYLLFPIVIGPLGFGGAEVNCVGEYAFPGCSVGSASSIEYPYVTTFLTKEDVNEPASYLNNVVETFRYSSSMDRGASDYHSTQFLRYQPVCARKYTSRPFMRGNLLAHSIGMPGAYGTKTTEVSYNIYENDDAPLLTTDAFIVADFTRVPGINTYRGYDYGIGKYRILPYNKTIKSQKTTEDDGLEQTEEYTYFYDDYTDKLDYNLIRSKKVSGSEYGAEFHYFTYKLGPGYYLPLPETEVVLNGSTIVSATRTIYDNTTRQPLMTFELSNVTDTTGIVSPTQATTLKQQTVINEKAYEYRYNTKGNVIEIRYKGAPLASYLWGYHGMYPIVEALNTDYDTLDAQAKAAGLTADEIENCKVRTQEDVRNLAAKLRIQMPGTNISSVAYHWLFGILEMTDASNVKTSYGYDSQGRLSNVRDFNNCLRQRHDYHYSNNPYYQ